MNVGRLIRDNARDRALPAMPPLTPEEQEAARVKVIRDLFAELDALTPDAPLVEILRERLEAPAFTVQVHGGSTDTPDMDFEAGSLEEARGIIAQLPTGVHYLIIGSSRHVIEDDYVSGDGYVPDADGRDARFTRTDDGHEDPNDYV